MVEFSRLPSRVSLDRVDSALLHFGYSYFRSSFFGMVIHDKWIMTMRTGELMVWLSKVIRLGAVWNIAKNVVAVDLLTFLIGVLEVPFST